MNNKVYSLGDLAERTIPELVVMGMTRNPSLKKAASNELLRRYHSSTSYETIVELGEKLGYSPGKIERHKPRPQLLNSTVQALVRNYKESSERVFFVFDKDIQIRGETENFWGDLAGEFRYNPQLGLVVPKEQKGVAFVARKALERITQDSGGFPAVSCDLDYYTFLTLALKNQGFDVQSIDGLYLEKRK